MTDPVSRIRVLIAEDDDNARSLLIDLLGTLGHTVVAEVFAESANICTGRSVAIGTAVRAGAPSNTT